MNHKSYNFRLIALIASAAFLHFLLFFIFFILYSVSLFYSFLSKFSCGFFFVSLLSTNLYRPLGPWPGAMTPGPWPSPDLQWLSWKIGKWSNDWLRRWQELISPASMNYTILPIEAMKLRVKSILQMSSPPPSAWRLSPTLHFVTPRVEHSLDALEFPSNAEGNLCRQTEALISFA